MKRSLVGRSIRRQGGLVLVMVTMAMLSLIGVAALAIDVNHAILNKSRLQNSVDAAALAAAIVIDKQGSLNEATSAANTTLNNSAQLSGHNEMNFASSNVTVQFSNDPSTFPDLTYSSSGDTFVRISVSAYELTSFFSDIFSIDKKISATAVAGPSSSLTEANVVPMAVCEGDEGGSAGYIAGDLYALKIADQKMSQMGSGNYQLLDFGSGASTVREGLAGAYTGRVVVGDTVLTKPGNTVGPVGQGLNTRFGIYKGGGLSESDYPSDVYVKEPKKSPSIDKNGDISYSDNSGLGGQPWSYSDYLAALPDCSGDSACRVGDGGQPDRRVLVVPIIDCSGASGGKSSFTVTALGCFFLLQQAPTNNGSKEPVYGEFIEDCSSRGGTPGQSSDSNGPYLIVLYKDPLGARS